MVRRLVVLGAAVAVLALTLSIVALAMSDQRYESVTLRLAEKSEDNARFNTYADVAKEGISVGDSFVLKGEPISNAARPRQVGVKRGQCLIVEVRRGEPQALECDGSFSLPAGIITWEGPVALDETGRFSLPVVGGTGAYETAHRALHVTGTDEAQNYLFRLLL